jgi:hypothetical protein
MLAVVGLPIVVGRAAAASPPTGLTGTVVRGPVTPVCRVGEPCEAPATNVELFFARQGAARLVRATTDAAGRYRVALPAGVYTVTTGTRAAIGGRIDPAHVHVRAGRVDRIDFSIDTGIR